MNELRPERPAASLDWTGACRVKQAANWKSDFMNNPSRTHGLLLLVLVALSEHLTVRAQVPPVFLRQIGVGVDIHVRGVRKYMKLVGNLLYLAWAKSGVAIRIIHAA